MECSSAGKFPYFKYGEPIDGCIEAAQNQDYENKEILLADKDERLGAGYIRNEAIKRANGEIVYFCDADAIMSDKHVISNLVKVFKETDIDVVVGGNIPQKKIVHILHCFHLLGLI